MGRNIVEDSAVVKVALVVSQFAQRPVVARHLAALLHCPTTQERMIKFRDEHDLEDRVWIPE